MEETPPFWAVLVVGGSIALFCYGMMLALITLLSFLSEV